MKLISKPFVGFFSATVSAAIILATLHFSSFGKDAAPPPIKVDKEPISRSVQLGTSFAPVVKKAAPSVVNIYSTHIVKERPMMNPLFNDPFFRQFFGDQAPGGNGGVRTRREQSLGSGVIVSPDGYILTANHVVADADEIKVSIGSNKKEFTAKVVGTDKPTDVAVLKIDAKDLPAVTLADSDQLEVGDVVLAIGNPFGVGQTVTMGIVSATGRSGLGFNGYENFIQTDAAINPGNSGGALIDANGRLVGINTAIISSSRGNEGIGLAVPINMARHVMERLITGGKVTRGYLGIIPQDITPGLQEQFNLSTANGALVGDVMTNTPAQKAGLQAGDVIVSVNGKDVVDAHSLQLTISELNPGTSVSLKVIRDGKTRTMSVTLGELPGSGNGKGQNNSDETSTTDALDGVTVADLDQDIRQQLRVPDAIQGAIVTDVADDSNAADAGLLQNDVIVSINRKPVHNSDDAVQLCKDAKGSQILVKIWRRNGDFAGTRYISVDNTKKSK